jgi:hypothetical protein
VKVEKHPNGFTKVVIGSIFGFRLRLHYWPKTAEKSYSRHNHRWWFISIPIIGIFVDNRYEEITNATTLRIDVADQGPLRDSERIYSMAGNSGLRLKAMHLRLPFLPYICRVGEIHSYYPKGTSRHASIVITSPIKARTSQIWRDPGELDVKLEG